MKFLCNTLFILLFGGVSFAQVDLNAGLIGCYPFSGNANDLSSSNNNGTVTGAKLTTDRFGNTNSAYEFNGIGDHIEISPKDLQINSFSYSLWVSPSGLPGSGEAFFLFSVGSDYGDQHILLGNQYTSGRHNAFAHGSYQGVGQNIRCTDETLPQLNQWYHIVLTKDAKNYYFYVNGKLICSNPVTDAAFFGTGLVRAMIGARNNYGQASKASIDDIHLYNRSLNQSEVEALYKGVDVIAATPVSIKADRQEPCGGDTIRLSADINTSVVEYQWKADGIPLPSENGNGLTYNLLNEKTAYDKTFDVQITYNSTCFPQAPSTGKIVIHVRNCPDIPVDKPRLFVPSVFTPNNDGVNDTWKIFNSEAYPDLEVRVFSRWGEVIFQSLGYVTAWDGKYRGQSVTGVYPYKITSSGTLIIEGTVYILR